MYNVQWRTVIYNSNEQYTFLISVLNILQVGQLTNLWHTIIKL